MAFEEYLDNYFIVGGNLPSFSLEIEYVSHSFIAVSVMVMHGCVCNFLIARHDLHAHFPVGRVSRAGRRHDFQGERSIEIR